jgi:hypothetical protein
MSKVLDTPKPVVFQKAAPASVTIGDDAAVVSYEYTCPGCGRKDTTEPARPTHYLDAESFAPVPVPDATGYLQCQNPACDKAVYSVAWLQERGYVSAVEVRTTTLRAGLAALLAAFPDGHQ